MPISRWYCAGCKAEVPLDHFAETDCWVVCDPDYAAAVLWAERKHHRFGRRVAGVTDVIGCPRQAALKQAVEYAVDPLNQTALIVGIGWHGMIEQAVAADGATRNPFTEKPLIEVKVEGKIDGVTLHGQIDRLWPQHMAIGDWKVKSDFSAGKKDADVVREDYLAQLVIGAELCEQTLGWRPTKGVIRQVFMVKGQAALVVDPLPPLDAVLDAPVLGGSVSLRDKLAWAGKWATGACEWTDMPLHGEGEFFGGKTRCDYCPVQVACWTQARGASF